MNKTVSLRLVAATAGTWLITGALSVAFAQAPGSTGPTMTPGATTVPLDGGASLLLAGGVALGLKKLRNRRRNG